MGEEHSQPRVVVFGATGYTGRMTAAALVQRGVRPLLAGRDENALRAMADELGGLEWARADASSPDALRALLTPEQQQKFDLLHSMRESMHHGGPEFGFGPIAFAVEQAPGQFIS